MKTNIFIVTVLCIFFSNCKSAADKNNSISAKQQLSGEWELNYINYEKQKFEELYSHKMPFLKFDVEQNLVSGNNGCNSFGGSINATGNKIDFKGPMKATKMYCEGEGERVFMGSLNKVESYSISKNGKELKFLQKDTVIMRFNKK